MSTPALARRAAVLLALALAALPTRPLGAQEISLEDRIRTHLGPAGSGLVVGVRHEGDVVLMKAWGAPGHGSPDSLTTTALFPFPAFTEVLLAATVRALDASGAVDARAPIGRYLPDLPERLGRVSLHDLLRHAGGLADAPSTAEGPAADVPLDSVVAGARSAVFTDPGLIYSHSRFSFPLAARALERAVGLPFEEVVAAALLRPLGMERSTFDQSEAVALGLARGYVVEGPGAEPEPVAEVGRVDGLPVLYTSVPDVVLFLSAWMDGLLATGPEDLPGPPTLSPMDRDFVDGFWRGRYQLLTELERPVRALGQSVVVRVFPEAGTAIVAWMNADVAPGAMEDSGEPGSATLPWDVADYVAERLLGPDIPVRVTEELPDSSAVGGADGVPLWAWAGQYVNGDRAFELRAPTTPGVEADMVLFNGSRELPLERLADGSVLARLPEDGRPAARFWLLRDAAGRRYVLFGGKAYRLLPG